MTSRAHWIVGAAVTLAFLVLFRETVLGGRLPTDVVDTNDVSWVGTVFEQAAVQVRDGHAPLWFPEFDCGAPLAAAWMYGLLYPGLALFAFLPLGIAWAWTAALHAGFGAAGMTLFLRRRGCDVPSAAVGAVLFTISEHFVGRTECGHLNLVLPLAWVPWILVFSDACVRGERRAVPLLALCGAAGILSGHVQIWMYVAPLVAAFALTEAWRGPSGDADGDAAPPGRSAWSRAAALRRLVVAALLGVGIAAAQISITAEFLAAAAPAAEDPDVVRAVSVPWDVLLTKFLGAFSGPPPAASDLGDFRHEHRGIAGIWAFGLALWGVLHVAPRRWFWAGFAVFGLVAAVGTRSPLTAWIQDVPPFSLARSPGRFLALPLVAIPILAAHGMAALALPDAKRRLVAAGVCTAAFLFGTPGVRARPDSIHRQDVSVLLTPEQRAHRIHSPSLYQMNNAERWGLSTLRTPCYVRTRGFGDLTSVPSKHVAYWLDLGADVDPVVREGTDEIVAFRTVGTFQAMGRAKFFGESVAGLSTDEILTKLRAGERVLYVDGAAETARGTAGTVTVAAWTPREIRLDVDATGAGRVLVSTKLYPGWTCDVDGAPGDVRRGNLGFPAVLVPSPGKHTVTLRYEPLSFRIGAIVSLAALATTLLLLVLGGRVSSRA